MLVSAAMVTAPALASRVHPAPTSGQAHQSHKSASVRATSSRSSAAPTETQGKGRSRHARGAHAEAVSAPAPSHRSHGQQSIAPERAEQIQQALIREHYMTGEPSGHWDSDTVSAMQKYQADQGWQTKLMPDSRALKKLGLGADYSNAINAKTGNFVDPPPVNTIPSSNVAGFTAGAGVND